MMFLPLQFNESFEFHSKYSEVKNVNSWNLKSRIFLILLSINITAVGNGLWFLKWEINKIFLEFCATNFFCYKTEIQNYLAPFGLCPSSGIWKLYKRPQRFGDWIYLRNVVVFCKTSTYQTMDRVQKKPNSSVEHTPSSESFQVYQNRNSPLSLPVFRLAADQVGNNSQQFELK
jgi:hypothetical protein